LDERIAKQVTTILIISAALVFGVITFSVLLAVVVGFQNIHFGFGLLTSIGFAFGVIGFAMAFLVARIVHAKSLELIRGDRSTKELSVAISELRERIAASLVTTTIIRYAVIESGIAINLICFYTEKSGWSLVGVGLGIGLMLLTFPLPSRVESWISDSVSEITGTFQA
jgi:hypothetical protein